MRLAVGRVGTLSVRRSWARARSFPSRERGDFRRFLVHHLSLGFAGYGGAGKLGREEVGEGKLASGETSAEKGEVGLDDGPEGGIDVI